NLTRVGGFAGVAETIALHKLTADWGEGTSVSPGGHGGSAVAPDATWQDRVYSPSTPTLLTTAGGDFAAAVSSSASINTTTGLKTWSSSAQMVADVQSWLNTPGTNFGWILIGDEGTSHSVKQFDTKEGSVHPVLSIDYTASASTAPTITSANNTTFTVGAAGSLD